MSFALLFLGLSLFNYQDDTQPNKHNELMVYALVHILG